MPNKFEKLVDEASHLTDEQFRNRFSSLTRFSDEDIAKIMRETGISKEDLAVLLQEIKKPGEINNKTAQSVSSIKGGTETIVAIIKRLLL